jgi:hypothetical protein
MPFSSTGGENILFCVAPRSFPGSSPLLLMKLFVDIECCASLKSADCAVMNGKYANDSRALAGSIGLVRADA